MSARFDELMVQMKVCLRAPFFLGSGRLKSLNLLSQEHPKDTKLTFGAAASCISLICLMNGQELVPIAENYNPFPGLPA